LLSAIGVNPPAHQIDEEGTEILVRIVEDPTFGPLIGFGLKGTATEIFNDMAFSLTPLTDVDAQAMVRAIRGFPLLQGYRGQLPADLEAIEDLLLRLSWLVEELPAIATLELNPVKVFAVGKGLIPVTVQVSVRA
jgi:acyl-CoA synthetase (NDP forming)